MVSNCHLKQAFSLLVSRLCCCCSGFSLCFLKPVLPLVCSLCCRCSELSQCLLKLSARFLCICLSRRLFVSILICMQNKYSINTMPILNRRTCTCTYLPVQNYCFGTNDKKKHGQNCRAALYIMHFCINTVLYCN